MMGAVRMCRERSWLLGGLLAFMLMLVRMVAEMPLHARAAAVLAIRPDGSPRILQWQGQEKQDEHRESPHAADYIRDR